ncbi:MAG TPA: RHS repeat-associated core domain-containing protein, partial [Longimicrobium sp.]|nr:RHS repeat-associated core domain-containing protein [Longimicrobium sp.]
VGGGGGLPPDPATVAPPLDRTTATTLAAATAFLYTGENPIQSGVAEGTIVPARAAVVRGRVLRRGGGALPGATVRVKGRPEFGQTLSRADGAFDLAVNGGEALTLTFDRAGFLPADRRVSPPWQGYAHAADVALVGLDPAVTTVAFGAGSTAPQVARATVASDADGARRATLVFDAGTEAVLEMPDGTTRPATSLNIRATEYTVGEGGPAAMPAELPSTSAYTYAVELSADEAIAAGAPHVRFTRPVALYLENFPGFPVGTPVPAGWYDREKAVWVPTGDGRVIRVVSVAGGAARVDADGDGAPDADAALDALGIDAAERGRLAGLYTAGETLWRVEVDHFSWIDLNWPRGPRRARRPGARRPYGPFLEDLPCLQRGSIVDCDNQVLGEGIGLAGTGLTLNYRSDRVPGRRATRAIEIPVSDSIPPGLREIRVEVEVAGRRFVHTLPPLPDQTYPFVWDGRDAYGRTLQGRHPATVRIGYVYPMRYGVPASAARSFGLACEPIEGSAAALECEIPATLNSSARREEVLWSAYPVQLGAAGDWDAAAQGLGGWTLDVHHAYDPVGRVLHLGDGSRRSADNLSAALVTHAHIPRSVGDTATTGPGGLDPNGIAVGPDGSIYIASFSGARVWRFHPDGRYTLVAGTGRRGCTGDGGPATEARFQSLNGVALGPDGSVYIEDSFNSRIRRVAPDGTISTFAGEGQCGTPRNPTPPADLGDGSPADRAVLQDPYGLAVGPDGTVYIADTRHNRIRRVGADGIIHTIAGTGVGGFGGDGGAARDALLSSPWGVEVGPDGSLYVSDTGNQRVRRIDPDGVITTIAGNGEIGFSGDGGPATAARLNDPSDVGFGPDGSVYIPDVNNYRLRRVGPDGVITTIAGNGVECRDTHLDCGDGSPPPVARLGWLYGVETGPDGSIYIADTGSERVRRIRTVIPPFSGDELVVASEDGGALFDFDPSGRHLRTRHALTGAVLFAFGYDAAGRLATVTDGDGGVTRIERDGAGAPSAVVGPFGHRTVLSVDAAGRLARVEGPDGAAVALTSTPDGLLTRLVDPNGHAHTFAYDLLGRLARDEDPRGGFQALTREATPDEVRVRRATAGGRVTFHRGEVLPTAARERVSTGADGLSTRSVRILDETRVTTPPGGGSVRQETGADPRFGLQAPFARASTLETPGGRRLATTVSRQVELFPGGAAVRSRTERVTVGGRTTVTAYDGATRRFTATSPRGRRSTARVDSLGRPVEVSRPGVLPTTYTYDAHGRVSEARQGARTWTYTYEDGFLASVRDPAGREDRFRRDAAGRLLAHVLPGGAEIGYAYDATGNVTAVTPPGGDPHPFAYTSTNLTERMAAPPVGGDSAATRYAYSLDGELTRVVRPGGEEAVFGYDSAGRVASAAFATDTLAYRYDAATGRLAGVETGEGALAFAFDGPLPLSATWTGAVAGTVSWSYDADLRVAEERVGGAHEAAFRYDADGLVTGVGVETILRDSLTGFLAGTRIGTFATRFGYDAFGQRASAVAEVAGAPLFAAAYERDVLGRVETATETVDGATVAWGYRYDAQGRLTEVTRDGAPFAAYEYDANGNRLRATSSAGVAEGTYDAQDRVTAYGGAAYGHTAAGELRFRAVGADTTWLTHDARGLLVEARTPAGTRVEYLVDGVGRRVGKRVDGALVQGFLYSGGPGPVAELDGAGGVAARFVYGTRPNVPDYMVREGRTYALVADERGSVRRVVDAATGEVVQALDYGPWGEVLRDSNPGFQPFGFAGGLVDAHTGLVRFGARDYDAATGRWTTRDPLGFGGKDTNLYRYVRGDPVNYVDIRGETPVHLAAAAIWGVVELGMSIADALDFAKTAVDPCASVWDKLGSGGLFALGMVAPGGGYGQVDNVAAAVTRREPADHPVLRQIIKEATLNGRRRLDADDAQTILDWAKEIGLDAHVTATDLATVNNHWDQFPGGPHIHVKGAVNGGHVPVDPSFRPRP